jgi:hypothetical protein
LGCKTHYLEVAGIFDVIYNIFPNKKTSTGNLYSHFIKVLKFTAKSVTRIVSKTLYLRGSGNAKEWHVSPLGTFHSLWTSGKIETYFTSLSYLG